MKIKIIKKSIKEGVSKIGKPYKICSLFVSVATPEDANTLAMKVIEAGGSKDNIEKFIRKNDYEDVITFQFNLNCHSFTLDRVERYGVLDINPENIIMTIADPFVNAKIKVEFGKELIDGYEAPEAYEAPEDEVTGWSSVAPEPKAPEPMGDGTKAEPMPIGEPLPLEDNLNIVPF